MKKLLIGIVGLFAIAILSHCGDEQLGEPKPAPNDGHVTREETWDLVEDILALSLCSENGPKSARDDLMKETDTESCEEMAAQLVRRMKSDQD